MKAQDIMSSPVITVTRDTPIQELARILVEHGISAVPVVDEAGKAVGIVSEGDLTRRSELGTERRPNWWLELLGTGEEATKNYLQSHGRKVGDVMSTRLISVGEEADIAEIAALLERHRIKRVPVLREGRPVGVVSRANLVRALAVLEPNLPAPAANERELRRRIEDDLQQAVQPSLPLNVIIRDGKVQVWGTVDSDTQQRAARVAIERHVSPEQLEFHVGVLPPEARRALWVS